MKDILSISLFIAVVVAMYFLVLDARETAERRKAVEAQYLYRNVKVGDVAGVVVGVGDQGESLKVMIAGAPCWVDSALVTVIPAQVEAR